MTNRQSKGNERFRGKMMEMVKRGQKNIDGGFTGNGDQLQTGKADLQAILSRRR